MVNTYKASYDALAALYEKWCTGDPAFGPCHEYYIQTLKQMPGPLVELGIGTGRIALELVEKFGRDVIGIDESAQMLQQVREKYEAHNSCGTLTLYQGNILDLQLSNPVPCIYLPFRTIGHITGTDEVLRLFRRIHQNLEPDGLFLFDHYIFSPTWAKANDQKRILMYEDPYVRIEDCYRYDFSNQLMDCSIYANDVEISRFTFAYHDLDYYPELLKRTGFTVEHLYGGYKRTELTEYSTEQIYVCRKRCISEFSI